MPPWVTDDRINPESKAFQILQSSNPKNPNSDNWRQDE
jgi:hypothetical protein